MTEATLKAVEAYKDAVAIEKAACEESARVQEGVSEAITREMRARDWRQAAQREMERAIWAEVVDIANRS